MPMITHLILPRGTAGRLPHPAVSFAAARGGERSREAAVAILMPQ